MNCVLCNKPFNKILYFYCSHCLNYNKNSRCVYIQDKNETLIISDFLGELYIKVDFITKIYYISYYNNIKNINKELISQSFTFLQPQEIKNLLEIQAPKYLKQIAFL